MSCIVVGGPERRSNEEKEPHLLFRWRATRFDLSGEKVYYGCVCVCQILKTVGRAFLMEEERRR